MITMAKITKNLLTLIFIATATASDLISLTIRLQSNNRIVTELAESHLRLEDAHAILQESLAPGEYMPPHQPIKNVSYTIKDGSCHLWISANGDDWTYHYCDPLVRNNMVSDGVMAMLKGYYYCFMAGKDGLSLEASQDDSDTLMLNPLTIYARRVDFSHIFAATQAGILANAKYIEVTFSTDIGAGRIWDC